MVEKDEQTQYTPKGLEIPIPTRKQVEDDLAKALGPERKPQPAKRTRGKKK